MNTLKDKVIFITGSTRGIGEAIALRCAKDGANIIITGKSAKPHPKLPGTLESVAKQVEELGGKAYPYKLDVRNETQIEQVVAEVGEKFGRIDVLVNNASAIYIAPTLKTPMKRFDLMFGVNVRATFACSQAGIPLLKKADNPHIVNLSPPLNMQAHWFKDHLAYTMSKYGMSMCTLGLSEELASDNIAVNSLWPATCIATMAIKVHFPEEILQCSRKPEIVADAAHALVTKKSNEVTGNFFTDEEVLQSVGVTDYSQYAVNKDKTLMRDLFLNDDD